MKKILSNIGVVSCCLVFSAIHSQAKAQTRTVTGTVNNEENPISGVTVTQEGTNEVTTTSSSGTFSLQIIGENPILIFRHPEYSERKINMDGKSTFNISLTEKVKSIEEVVLNAGYYNVKARESTGSIAKVTAKDIENQPVNNVLSAVQGRMAGVSITQNSGNAGGGYDILIRGKNSVRSDGNYPLIIVDGVPLNTQSNSISRLATGILSKGESSPLNAINPNNIESIEVLKDADATAIYGSRGANGVVLVTTKRGSQKELTAELTLSTSISHANRFLKLANTEQYKQLRADAFKLDAITIFPTNAYDMNGKWDSFRYTDWYKTFLGKNFLNQQQHLALSGGGIRQNYMMTIFNSNQGTVYGNDFNYKRKGFNFSSNYYSKDKKFRITPSVYYTIENNNLSAEDLSQKVFLSPNAPALYTPTGKVNWEDNTFQNPIAKLANKYQAKTNTFSARALAEYQLNTDWSFRINAGYSQTLQKEFRTSPSTQYNPTTGATSQYSSITLANIIHENWIAEPQLNWQKTWKNHRISALVGTTFEERTNNLLRIQASDFSSNELLYNLANAKVQKVVDDTEINYRYEAFYGRLNYNISDKYILNLTARRDGSSRFGPQNRFANFGAVGVAWIFSEENFLKENKWFTYGKLRGSFGVTGNDQIGDYQYLNTYTTSTQTYDLTVGLYPSRLYNPDFSWERTAKLEAGLELAFFHETLNLTLAWYQNRSSNQLVGLPLAATTGFLTMQQNFPAKVQNTGLEIDLTAKILKKKKVNWNMMVNLSLPQSKLLEFPNIETSSYVNTYEVGKSMNIRRVYEYMGLDPNTGIYQFRDFNNDGKINSSDRKKSVDYGMRYYGGITNQLQFKNISLQFLLQYVNQTQLDTMYSLATPGFMFNVPAYMLDYWTPENPNATYQRPTTGANAAAVNAFDQYINSDAAIVDASFLRLNSMQLSYQIPFGMIKNSQLEIGVHAQNLLTVTKFRGLDPEVQGSYLPTLKTYSLTAILKF